MDKKELVNKISYLISKKNHDQAYAVIREFEKNSLKMLSFVPVMQQLYLILKKKINLFNGLKKLKKKAQKILVKYLMIFFQKVLMIG